MDSIIKFLFSEIFFFSGALGLIITSIIEKRLPDYSLSDFKVILTLFSMMIIVKTFEDSGILNKIALKFGKGNKVTFKLILATGFFSMIFTNDIALLAIIPITLSIAESRYIPLIITLEVIAANLFSAISPIGNPQNIFIYFHYHLTLMLFLKIVLPFFLPLILIIVIFSFFINNTTKNLQEKGFKISAKTITPAVSFLILLLIITGVLPFVLILLIPPTIFAIDRNSYKIDYFLLGTFIVFFGFTDNLKEILNISLINSHYVFFTSILLSQIISNVPATCLLADFTSRVKPLLLGVNIGGLGTFFASFANIIGYKLTPIYLRKKFSIIFFIVNILFLVLSITIWIFWYYHFD